VDNKREVIKILENTERGKITTELLKQLETKFNIGFQLIELPRFAIFPKLGDNEVRLYYGFGWIFI